MKEQVKTEEQSIPGLALIARTLAFTAGLLADQAAAESASGTPAAVRTLAGQMRLELAKLEALDAGIWYQYAENGPWVRRVATDGAQPVGIRVNGIAHAVDVQATRGFKNGDKPGVLVMYMDAHGLWHQAKPRSSATMAIKVCGIPYWLKH